MLETILLDPNARFVLGAIGDTPTTLQDVYRAMRAKHGDTVTMRSVLRAVDRLVAAGVAVEDEWSLLGDVVITVRRKHAVVRC